MKKTSLFILLPLVLSQLKAPAQATYQKTAIRKGSADVIAVITDKNHDITATLTSVQSPVYRVESGERSGDYRSDVQQRLIFTDGHEQTLTKNEMYLHSIAGFVLTAKADPEKELNTYVMYKVNKTALEQMVKVEGDVHGNCILLSGGWIAVNDEYELYGTGYTLYSGDSPNGTLIKPYEKGFKASATFDNENTVWFYFCPSDAAEKSRLYSFEKNSGKVSYTEFPNPGFTPTLLSIAGDKVVLYGELKLAVFTTSGQLLWNKDLILPHLQFQSDRNGELLLTEENGFIRIYTLSDGKYKYEFPIVNLIPDAKLNANDVEKEIRILQMAPARDKIILIAGVAGKGIASIENLKQQLHYIEISNTGALLKNENLDTSGYALQLNINNSIQILTGKHAFNYEN